jgi:hypothetical protein
MSAMKRASGATDRGAFDFEIEGLKLMAFSVAVVIVGLVEYAVFIVLIRGFGGGLPLC